MSLTDIIEAAIVTAKAVRDGSDRGIEGSNRRKVAYRAAEDFRATFDPTLTAALVRLYEAWLESHEEYEDLDDAGNAIVAILRERGLE